MRLTGCGCGTGVARASRAPSYEALLVGPVGSRSCNSAGQSSPVIEAGQRPHRISEVKSPSRRTCAAPPQKAGFSEIASAQTLWSNDLATNRQPGRHEVVTHVLGTFCYPCLRAGQIDSGERGGSRTVDPMIKSYDLAHILTPVRIQFSDDSTRSAHFIGLTRDIFQQRAIITNQLCSPLPVCI